MPQCVFKNCKNNPRKCNIPEGVSYFRFPGNPHTCAKWISIVAREREDEYFIPAKNSVICSEHFDKSDICGNVNRHRLVKKAVPKLRIQPPEPQMAELNTKTSVSHIEVQDADEEIKKELEPIEELTIEEHFTTPSGSIDMDSCLKNIEDETIITIDGTKRDSVNTKGSNSDSDENNQQIKVEPSHCNTNENHLIGDIVSEINRNVLNILQVVNKEADEFETFGKYVAIVLRNLPPDVAATAKRELLATLANIQKKIYT
ncbi:uncharacterized protein LOC119832861 isoform X2 [Zerene cesonia]|uniref:uncharacterized protein LOC119832861 isoform X2 n=1 Tax=Zerene cesonia TaxID=33412 RepID=UPI0018E59C5E|nr:uncharacterized protein LOC119832861 isoform X2 [Zerene cesonia]